MPRFAHIHADSDWATPDLERWHDTMRRSLVVEFLGTGLFVFKYVYFGAPWAIAGTILAQLCALAGLVALRYRHYTAAAYALVFGLYSASTLVLLDTGGFSSVVMAWLVVVPIVGGLLFRARVVVGWTVLCGLTVFGYLTGEHFAGPTRNLVPEHLQTFHTTLEYLGLLATSSVVILLHLRTRHRERSAVEASQRSLRAELAERTRAEEASRASSEAKDRFMAMISHEIRTPMNGVLGMTDLLRRSDLASSDHELAEAAHQSAETLLGLINDLLDFSKLQAGEVHAESVDFDLRRLLEDVCDVFAVQAHEKGLALALEVDAELSRVRSDPARLRQIMLNLVGNAIKFTDAGQVTVTARAAPNEVAKFAVRDTGIGIPQDVLPNLFSPFTQADSSINRRFGGTGLGLSVAQGLAGVLGGRIEARSSVGDGSTFELVVPMPPGSPTSDLEVVTDLEGQRVLVFEPHPAERRALTQALAILGAEPVVIEQPADVARAGAASLALIDSAARASFQPALGELRACYLTRWSGDVAADGPQDILRRPVHLGQLSAVCSTAGRAAPASSESTATVSRDGVALVVDDNAINRMVARRLLERLGYAVEVAADGKEAFELACTGAYEVVLMDCQMPVMDGYEATRRLRTRLGARCPPVIGLSAAASLADRARALEAGMDDYVTKPVALEDLRASLAALTKPTAPAPATAANPPPAPPVPERT